MDWEFWKAFGAAYLILGVLAALAFGLIAKGNGEDDEE